MSHAIERPLEAGDILSYEWGSTMSLVEYFKIVAVTKSSVKIQKMTTSKGPEDRAGNCRVSPVDVDASAPVMTKRVKISWDNTRLGVAMTHGSAWLWSGKPLTQNTYD